MFVKKNPDRKKLLFISKFPTDLKKANFKRAYKLQDDKKYALVIARFRVQYGQYFPSFPYFADLFHEPLGE